MRIPLKALVRELNRRNISFAQSDLERELALVEKAEKELKKIREASASRILKKHTPQENKIIREKILRIKNTLPIRPYDIIFNKGFKILNEGGLFPDADPVFEATGLMLNGLLKRSYDLMKQIQKGK